MRRALSTAAAISAIALVAACGSGGPGSGGSGSDGAAGPVDLEFWGWNQGQQAQVDLYNSIQDDVHVTYVEQSGEDIVATLTNAVKADNAPDLVQTLHDTAVSLLVDGITQDVAPYLTDTQAYDPAAISSVEVGDAMVGVPFQSNPQFALVNTKVYADNGLKIPTSWSEYIETGKTLATKGIKTINLAGEDPSTLTYLARQFGANWYSVDGDRWVVDFTSPESLAAGNVIQQFVDNDLVSHETYIEWDNLMQYFASGQMASILTSTWQLPVYEQNFAQSIGDWKAVPWPTEKTGGDVVSPGNYLSYAVPATTDHAKEAVAFANWLATDPKAIKLAADTVKGSGSFPVVADPNPYIDSLIPQKLLGENRDGAAEVVEQAVSSSRVMTEGPDQAGALLELADGWAKVLNKEQTTDQLLEHMQQWVVADLKAKGIDVAEG